VSRGEDRVELLDTLNAGNPMAWQAYMWADLDATSDTEFHWFVGCLDGQPAGFGVGCPVAFAADGFGVGMVHVLPEARGRGVGSVLREAVTGTMRGKVPGVLYSWYEGDKDAEAAVAAWGLRETARHRESVLDLSTIDRNTFESRSALAAALTLDTLPDFSELGEPEWRNLYDFAQERFREAPDSQGGGGEIPFDVFRGSVSAPWALLTASDEDRLVGFTCVVPRAGDPEAMNTFFTGVHPDARGRGLAAAMKARHALLLADRGMTRIYTQNMDGNEPILATNKAMGFRPYGGYVDVIERVT
jgi:GNAT superfamily N-acetyltransferase